MSAIGALMNQSFVERLGWVLLHSIWQGGVVAIIFGLLRVALRRCSANIRYLTACAALLVLAGAPLATAVYGPINLAPHAGGYRAVGGIPQAGLLAAKPNGAQTPAPGSGAWLWLLEGVRALERCLPSIVVAWMLGVVMLCCRWLRGYWWIRQVRTVQVTPLDDQWVPVLEYLKCRFNIRQRIRLVQSALADVPLVVGWLKPVILIPASAVSGLSPDQLESILAHELAHVRRYDYLVNAFQNVLETLLFYHPAVWWISNCIREEREHCCDDLVVRVCNDRLVYARALFRLEELRGVPARLALAASGGSLLQRIRRLVGGPPEVWPVTVREFSGLALLAIGCVFLVAGACLTFGTETYSSTVRIRVEREHPTVFPPGSGSEMISPYDPYFIQTEFEVLQSQVILGKVIQELNLNEIWGRKYPHVLKTDETMELLKRQMDLRPVRNTSIIEIRIYDEDGNMAAQIANTIARVYADYRARKREKAIGGNVDALLVGLKEQEALVLRAQSNVDRLRKELNVQETASAENLPSALLTAETLRRVEALRLESQAEYVRSKELLDRLQNLKPDELVQAIPTAGIPDSTLNQLIEQKNLVDQRLVATEKEFGPESVEVTRLQAQAGDLRRKIKERADGILAGLDARVASLRQGLTDLSNEVAKAIQADVEKASARGPYFQAKRHLEERQRFLQMLQLKIVSEKTDLQLPRSSAVEIVDPASPPLRPFSPNRPRAIALMGCGLLLSVLGLILVKSGRSRASALTAT